MKDNVKSIEQVLKEDGVWVGTTSGRSMEPMLHHRRNTVVVKPADRRLRRYDVALYYSGEKILLHRVLRARERDYLIRGDHCDFTEVVADEQILGVMVSFTRGKRSVSADNPLYRLYAALWVFFHPLEKAARRGRVWLARCYRKFVPKK